MFSAISEFIQSSCVTIHTESSDEVVSDPETESDFVPPTPTSPLPLTRSEEQRVEQCTRIGLVATHKCSSDILTEDDRREMAAIRASLGMLPRKSEGHRPQRQYQVRATEELSQSSDGESSESEYEDNNCQNVQKNQTHNKKSGEREDSDLANQIEVKSKSESHHHPQSVSENKLPARREEEKGQYTDLHDKDDELHSREGHLITDARVTAADTHTLCGGGERDNQRWRIRSAPSTRGRNNDCTTEADYVDCSQYRVRGGGERFKGVHHHYTVDCRQLQRKSQTCCGYSKCGVATNTAGSAGVDVSPKRAPSVGRVSLLYPGCFYCQPCNRHFTRNGYFGETFCNFPLYSDLHSFQQQAASMRVSVHSTSTKSLHNASCIHIGC